MLLEHLFVYTIYNIYNIYVILTASGSYIYFLIHILHCLPLVGFLYCEACYMNAMRILDCACFLPSTLSLRTTHSFLFSDCCFLFSSFWHLTPGPWHPAPGPRYPAPGRSSIFPPSSHECRGRQWRPTPGRRYPLGRLNCAANILIFPCLEAANTRCKTTQPAEGGPGHRPHPGAARPH